MATWNKQKRRWQASAGTGRARTWFYSRTPGPEGEAEVEAAKREFVEGPPPPPPGSLLEFFESVAWPRWKAKGLQRETLRPRLSRWRNWIEPALGHRLVAAIRFEELQEFLGWLGGDVPPPSWVPHELAGREPLGRKSVKHVRDDLRYLFRLAVRLKRLDANPMELVEIAPAPAKRRTNLDAQLVGRIMDAAAGTPMEGVVWCLTRLGLRPGELLGLKRTDVELRRDSATVAVREQRSRDGVKARLKARSEDDGPRVLAVPRAWGERMLAFGHPDSLYLITRGRRPVSPWYADRQMRAICERLGIEPNVTPHDLRAAANSNLKAAGVPKAARMRILGHRSAAVNDIYEDRRPADEEAAMVEAFERLASLYEPRAL